MTTPLDSQAPANTATPHRLDRLLQARSIVILGASERNAYAISAVGNLRTIGFDGRLHLVNQRGGIVFGQAALTSVAAIGEAVDLAYLCVPLASVLDTLRDCVAAGIRNFVVLTSGFAEVGGEGVALQQELVELCRQHDLNVLGPNCLGFVNYADRLSLGSVPVVMPQPPAAIAVVSASGATAHQLSTYAQLHGIGLTHVIATGNEANITTADCVDYLLAQPAVKSIAIFLEAVRDPEKFLALATRALQLRKAIVVLKVGAAPATAAVAAAHTGALVGDDKVFDAVCERYGIVRVDTFERLITTSAALANIGVLDAAGVVCLSVSGGACEVMSDLAATHGVPLPAYAPATRTALEKIVSSFGQLHNPLDLTGAAIKDPTLWEQMIRIIARDPQIGLLVVNSDPPQTAEERMLAAVESITRGFGELAGGAVKTQMITSYIRPLSRFSQDYFAARNLPVPLSGMGDAMAAIGKVVWWSERVRHFVAPARSASAASDARPASEQEALAYLQGHGVPVVPSRVATSAAAAARFAGELNGPVALKIASPDIAHKTDIGGVLLNLAGDAAVTAGFERILANVRAAQPTARLDGVAVVPMRAKGTELFVGIARDPQWGLVLALGLGGVWVEVLNDTRLCLLPVRKDEVVAALKSLRAAKLLQGYRGAAPIDLDAVADVVVAIGAAALALGPTLAAFEINPLLVSADASGQCIEALDALAIWS